MKQKSVNSMPQTQNIQLFIQIYINCAFSEFTHGLIYKQQQDGYDNVVAIFIRLKLSTNFDCV